MCQDFTAEIEKLNGYLDKSQMTIIELQDPCKSLEILSKLDFLSRGPCFLGVTDKIKSQ